MCSCTGMVYLTAALYIAERAWLVQALAAESFIVQVPNFTGTTCDINYLSLTVYGNAWLLSLVSLVSQMWHAQHREEQNNALRAMRSCAGFDCTANIELRPSV